MAAEVMPASGGFYKRNIEFLPAKRSIVFNAAQGTFKSKFNSIKTVLHGFDVAPTLKVNGSSTRFNTEDNAFLTPVSTFDPQGTTSASESQNSKNIILKNSNDRITIRF